MKEGRAEEVACVIFAPAAYLAHTDAACFNLTVSYEELAAYFAGQAGKASGELAARYLHRGEVIEQAIGKCRRGYEVVADPTNTSFWKGYYELASTVAPELQMDGPGEKPTYSIDIYFKQALPRVSGLRKAWLLKHSLENGVAMIEVSHWGTRFDALEPVLRPALEADMLLRQAGKSIQIRLPAPTLDTSKPLPSQATEASAGIEVLKRLRSWYLKHAEVVGKCQWIAEPVGV